jgi:hypothetical protein
LFLKLSQRKVIVAAEGEISLHCWPREARSLGDANVTYLDVAAVQVIRHALRAAAGNAGHEEGGARE